MNVDVGFTLEEAVHETMSNLIGIDYSYESAHDRFHVVTRLLNKALRSIALEHEWSYFSTMAQLGESYRGQRYTSFSTQLRLRSVGDDAVRLQDLKGNVLHWAYILPKDALHKYRYRSGLWAAATRNMLEFSRPLSTCESGLTIVMPAMREPRQFKLSDPGVEIPLEIRTQQIDFDYPDLVTARAAYLFAQSDPVLQPRVQTLEAQYKDIMYQLVERDKRHTDSAEMNPFYVPIESGIDWHGPYLHGHPHADERWL